MSPSLRRRPTLATAVALFAQRGYAGTSVDHLSAATELDPAAFRLRFATKEGCFLQAFDRILAVAQGHLAASLRGEQPWPARVAATLRRLLELIDANPAAARLVFVESHFAGPAALERYTATVEGLASFMRQGRQCSTAPERLPPIIDFVLPGGVAFSLRCQLLSGDPARDLYAELLRFLLLPYLGETETAARLELAPRPRASKPPG